MTIRFFASLLIFFCAPAFAGNVISAETYLTKKGQSYLQRYTNASNRLADDFNLICGDIFCQGQFGQVLPLPMRCFVDSENGQIANCVWAFGRSSVWIGRNSEVQTDGKVFFCEFKPDLTVEAFILTIENARVSGQTPYLSLPIPGVPGNLVSVLSACLR